MTALGSNQPSLSLPFPGRTESAGIFLQPGGGNRPARGLELPLIFEERGLVDIGKDFVEIEIFEDARAPEDGLGISATRSTTGEWPSGLVRPESIRRRRAALA